MLWNTIWLALRSIRRNLLRSFLTVLGIVIGVSAVITMVTLGNVAAPTTLLAVFGFFVIVALEYRKVTGAIIIGVLLVTLLSVLLGMTEFKGVFAARRPSSRPSCRLTSPAPSMPA